MEKSKVKATCSATLLAISVLAVVPGAFAQNTNSQGSQGMAQTGQGASGAQSQGKLGVEPKAQPGTQPEKMAGTSQVSSGQQGVNNNTVLYMIVSIPEIDWSQAMKSGCWARLYDDQSFRGDSLTISGPADMTNMRGPLGSTGKTRSEARKRA